MDINVVISRMTAMLEVICKWLEFLIFSFLLEGIK